MNGYELLKLLSVYDDDELYEMTVYVYDGEKADHIRVENGSVDPDDDLIFDVTL